jgi:uncharacterized protein (TIGR03067 family)
VRAFTLLAVLVCLSPAAAQHPDATQREARRLEGVWVVVSDQGMNPVLDDVYVKGARWKIDAGQITFERELKQKPEERPWRFYRVDVTRNPRTIEVTLFVNQGRIALFSQRGLYVLEGDRLKLYLADVNAEQPVRFPRQPKELDQHPVLTLQRVRR